MLYSDCVVDEINTQANLIDAKNPGERDCTEEQDAPPRGHEQCLQINEDSEPIVRPLVRKCFLQNLKKAVEENLSILEPASETDIIACTLKLEKRVLQKSALTLLYQQAMRQIICDIQLKSRKRLTRFDKNHNYLNIDFLNQFENDSVSSLCDSTPFLTPPSDYSHLSENSYPFSNGSILNSEPTTVVRNIHSPNVFCITEDKTKQSIYENLQSKIVTSPDHNNFPECRFNGMDATIQTLASRGECVSEPSYAWIEEEMARVCGEAKSSNSNFDELKAPERKDSDGLTTPTAPSVQLNQLPKENIDWRLLRLKHEAELEEKLKRLDKIGGINKRARLEKRFMQLFGADIAYAKKERDEIASLTVKHLMPFYKKQKITSRELFKKVAKHISDSLMEMSTLPDENDIALAVQQFFRAGRSITCETDMYR